MMMRFRYRRILALLLCAACAAAPAAAAELALPDDLEAIEAEAFQGDASIREVALPEGVQSIGERAFADCANLGRIAIPGQTAELGADFVKGCAEELLIQTDAGSAAQRYAQANRIDYQADTTYRALVIAQSYKGTSIQELDGPPNDARNFRKCLALYPGTPYQLEVRSNLSAGGIKSAIRECFGGATERDVSLLYYSGHGVQSSDLKKQGALVGVDGRNVTADDLRAALDEIPGRKVVIIDACYSGNLLSDQLATTAREVEEPGAGAEEFVDSFIFAFSRRTRANLAGENYFVLTAAADDEPSYEGSFGGNSGSQGIFTAFLLMGCGCDNIPSERPSKYADESGNGDISLREAYEYVYPMLADEGEYAQHVQVYPSDCGWFCFLRS